MKRMKTKFSKFVFVISCIVALLTVAAAYWWISGLLMNRFPQTAAEDEAHQRGGWNCIAFIYLVAPVLGGVSLLCVIASTIILFRQRQRADYGVCFWRVVLSLRSLVRSYTCITCHDLPPNKGAASNCRPALQSDGSEEFARDCCSRPGVSGGGR